jgi:hypothetical protein
MDVEQQVVARLDIELGMRELNGMRAEVDKVAQTKSRLTGALDSGRKRMQELQAESNKQFKCDTEQLPKVMDGFAAEYDASMQGARDTLATSAAAPAQE